MDVYNLSKVDSTIDGPRSVNYFGFDVIGINGRPVVGFSFKSEGEADAAHTLMREVVRNAKVITPYTIP
jgi:hypothetical protein